MNTRIDLTAEGPEVKADEWSIADHQNGKGKWFPERYSGLAEAIANAVRKGHWQYFRVHDRRIGTEAEVLDEALRPFRGVNGASQDYLGLAEDPRVVAGAKRAIDALGVHSAGSPAVGGGTSLSRELESRLGRLLGREHVILYPTGWAAGYGAIYGLVRQWDHVVIDALAHNCLQHGAMSATRNVHRYSHNDLGSLENRLDRVRQSDPDGAVLIVTETLFSMDSDSPDVRGLVELKRRYEAHLLLDVAHDFGALGPGGMGLGSEQYADVDYIMGSFSKTFASIGGFVASNDLASKRALQTYSGAHAFSNFLIPAQLGAVLAALEIVFSAEGEALRAGMLANSQRLRDGLGAAGIPVLGVPSAMVIVEVGEETVAREAYRRLLERQVIVNCIEYPAVRKGGSRFRIQLSPKHTPEQIAWMARAVIEVLGEVRGE